MAAESHGRHDDRFDVVVIGGGLVGLAIARALALAGREVAVLEAEPALGQHASSRNSEVIHAGIYYPPGSLKAELCVRGKILLYAYAERAGIPHARIGKLIVATSDDEAVGLDGLLARARDNGVSDLEWLDARAVAAFEPNVRAVRALFSPSTGIIDAHALLTAFKRDTVQAGAHVLTSTRVAGGRVGNDGVTLELGGAAASTVHALSVVNAAGFHAPAVSRSIAGLDPRAIPRERYAKGHYYRLQGPAPFRHLVYPLPVAGGLGVHVTLDLAGNVRFGPDLSWVDSVDYAFDERRAEGFYAAIRRYYPALADGSLLPAYTGIRAKLGAPGTAHDFVIQDPLTTGAAGFVALYAIESPGLTAALAIAERVRALLSAD